MKCLSSEMNIIFFFFSGMEACVLTKIIFIIIKFAKITKLDFVVLNNPNHNGVNGAHGENVQYHVVEVIDNLVFRNKYFFVKY